jgi:ubiquinone/menaquinone biosynthesis C-methylase UbiE
MQYRTPEAHMTGAHAGLGYELHAALFFGGRRRRVFRRLASLSGAAPGDRVLDVGCGTGYFTRVMAEAVAPGGTALGIDPCRGAIGRARHVTRLPNCSFSEGVAQFLDLPDNSCDVVVSSLMIHHLPEGVRPQAVSEMLRVLRPAGRLLLAEFRPPRRRVGRILLGPFVSPAMLDNPMDELEPMVHAAGFGEPDVGDVRPWIGYVRAAKPAR